MGLESGTWVNDLVSTNPLGTDFKEKGDDHLRLIKTVLKNTFPNASRAFRFVEVPAAKTGAYVVVVNDQQKLVRADVSGGGFTVTLPPGASLFAGWAVTIMKSDSSANSVTIDGNGAETINGALTKTLSDEDQCMSLMWDGSEWKIVAHGVGNPSNGDFLISDGAGGYTFTDAMGVRTALSLVVGTNVQAWDATLQSIAALGTAADRMIYTTAVDTWAETTITALARTLLDDTTEAGMRATLLLGALATLSTVGTAQIDNDAVTLDKVAPGTAGHTNGYNASGDPTTFAPGAAKQVLTSNGASVAPSYQANIGGWSDWDAVDLTNGGADDQSQFDFITGASGLTEIDFVISDASCTLNWLTELLIGDAGVIKTTGYSGRTTGQVGSVNVVLTNSTEYKLSANATFATTAVQWGWGRLSQTVGNINNNWELQGNIMDSNGRHYMFRGSKLLSGALTDVRIRTTAGFFDGGVLRWRTR